MFHSLATSMWWRGDVYLIVRNLICAKTHHRTLHNSPPLFYLHRTHLLSVCYSINLISSCCAHQAFSAGAEPLSCCSLVYNIIYSNSRFFCREMMFCTCKTSGLSITCLLWCDFALSRISRCLWTNHHLAGSWQFCQHEPEKVVSELICTDTYC